MAQIARRCRDLLRRQTGQFPSDDADGAAVALLAEEYAAQRGLAAGHGIRYADDVPGVGRQRQPPKDRRSASLLDTFSCIFQGIIPYGAQMLVAISTCATLGYAISAFDIIPLLF